MWKARVVNTYIHTYILLATLRQTVQQDMHQLTILTDCLLITEQYNYTCSVAFLYRYTAQSRRGPRHQAGPSDTSGQNTCSLSYYSAISHMAEALSAESRKPEGITYLHHKLYISRHLVISSELKKANGLHSTKTEHKQNPRRKYILCIFSRVRSQYYAIQIRAIALFMYIDC